MTRRFRLSLFLCLAAAVGLHVRSFVASLVKQDQHARIEAKVASDLRADRPDLLAFTTLDTPADDQAFVARADTEAR